MSCASVQKSPPNLFLKSFLNFIGIDLIQAGLLRIYCRLIKIESQADCKKRCFTKNSGKCYVKI